MKRSRSVAVVTAAMLLGVAACGDDEEASTTTTEAAGEAATTTAAGGARTTAAGGAGGAAPSTAAPQAADDSLPPVKIGFHNLEGGAISLPEIADGFQSGINYVNEELGGINGRPIEISFCNLDVTPESSVNCANQFVEEQVVVAVQGVDVAADAALPILQQADIAEIGFFAFSPGMNAAQGDAFFTLFSNEEGYAADLLVQQSLGAQKEAMVLADLPTSKAIVSDVVEPTAEKLGMEVQAFYYPTQTDWTSFAATIIASNPDAVSFPAPEEQVCLAGVPALRSAGFTGPIHAGSCAQIVEELDFEGTLENVIVHSEFYYPTFTDIPAKSQQDIDTYLRFVERDFPDFESLLYTQLGFHVAVQAADMLRQVPGDDITASTVKAALPNTKGTKFFSEGTYDCSAPTWPGTSACGEGLLFAEITEDKQKAEISISPVDVSQVRPDG